MSSPAPLPPHRLPPPLLVEDEAGMRALLSRLEACAEIAFDTEADSFFHYQERVCLIQVTAGDRDYLVDPLRGLDLSGLGAVLADATKTKVFHDGEYDVLILKRDYGFSFENLFDTRVAAAALGSTTPGLASVLQERFGIELDKSLQRSDWSARPLTERQISYARLDTHYLVALMRCMRGELDRKGRMRVVEGECRRLEALEPSPRTFHPDEFIRIKGARALDPIQMQRLRELYVTRDSIARERDVPPFKVLGNAELVRIAERGPRNARELRSVEHLSPKIVHRLGGALLQALRRAQELGPLRSVPRLPSRDGTGELGEPEVELHERLKLWRKAKAKAEGLDSSLILNRHVLLELVKRRPTSRAEMERVDGMLAWQIELFGEEILDVIRRFERALSSGEWTPRRRRRG